MKRLLLSLILVLGLSPSLFAMSYEEAREQAWFLTDKMAYELNLTPEQCNRAYEVNLDYLLNLRTYADVGGAYWTYRDMDLRCILFDWQYSLYRSLDYFFYPVRWVRSRWYYPVCDHYRYGYFFFDRPAIYVSYQGGMWRRRGHNDRSPYAGMRFDRGNGMRDRYMGYNRPGNPTPGQRPPVSGGFSDDLRGGFRQGNGGRNQPGRNQPGNEERASLNHGGQSGQRGDARTGIGNNRGGRTGFQPIQNNRTATPISSTSPIRANTGTTGGRTWGGNRPSRNSSVSTPRTGNRSGAGRSGQPATRGTRSFGR